MFFAIVLMSIFIASIATSNHFSDKNTMTERSYLYRTYLKTADYYFQKCLANQNSNMHCLREMEKFFTKTLESSDIFISSAKDNYNFQLKKDRSKNELEPIVVQYTFQTDKNVEAKITKALITPIHISTLNSISFSLYSVQEYQNAFTKNGFKGIWRYFIHTALPRSSFALCLFIALCLVYRFFSKIIDKRLNREDVLSKDLDKTKGQLDQTKGQLATTKQQLAQVNQQRFDYERMFHNMNTIKYSLEQELHRAKIYIDQKDQELSDRITALEQERNQRNKQYQQNILRIEQAVKKLEQEKILLLDKPKNQQEGILLLDKPNIELENQRLVEKLRHENTKLQQEIKQHQSKVGQFILQMQHLEQHLMNKQNDLDSFKQREAQLWQDKNNILNENKRLKELSAQSFANKAEIEQAQARLSEMTQKYHNEVNQLKQDKEIQEQEYRKYQDQYESLMRQFNLSEQEKSNLNELNQKQRKEINQLNQRQIQLQQEKEELLNHVHQNAALKNHLNAINDELTQIKSAKEANEETFRQERINLLSKNNDLKNKLDENKRKIQEITQQVQQTQEQLKQKEQEINQLHHEMRLLKESHQSANMKQQEELNQIQLERDELDKKRQEEISSKSLEIQKLVSQIQDKESEIKRLSEERHELTEQLLQSGDMKGLAEIYQQENNDLKNKCTDLEREIKNLQAQNNNELLNSSKNNEIIKLKTILLSNPDVQSYKPISTFKSNCGKHHSKDYVEQLCQKLKKIEHLGLIETVTSVEYGRGQSGNLILNEKSGYNEKRYALKIVDDKSNEKFAAELLLTAKTEWGAVLQAKYIQLNVKEFKHYPLRVF